MDIKLGADPEVFVMKNGIPFCAHGMVPGTKKEPYPVAYGAIQVDGFALEFNIEPATSQAMFVHNIHTVFSMLENRIPKDCRIHVVPSLRFDWDHMKAQPKEALELGCDPDYNAYTGNENIKPNGETNLRTAAGHVHVGWTSGQEPMEGSHFNSAMVLMRQLDFYLGLPSLILDEHGRERRELYGKAGAFRSKPYGAEYRVLSNFWLTSKELTGWVYHTTIRAIHNLMAGYDLYDKYGFLARNCIDGVQAPARMIDELRRERPELWKIIDPFDGNNLRGVQ